MVLSRNQPRFTHYLLSFIISIQDFGLKHIALKLISILVYTQGTCVNLIIYERWSYQFKYYLLQLVFSACVAVVKRRPVLYHCVVIFVWSSGIMECTCMLFTF